MQNKNKIILGTFSKLCVLTSINVFFVHKILPNFALSNCYGGNSGSGLKRLEIIRALFLPDYIRKK